MNKCIASKNGECRNLYACGLKCDGYSSKCRLKEQYDEVENTLNKMKAKLREAYGIVSDKE